jgi:hypothetical protein
MTNDDERLDDDLLALVRREARAPELPKDHVDRARERLETRLFMSAGVLVAASAATAASTGTAAIAGTDGAGAAATSVGRALAVGKIAGLVALVFGGGIATGWIAKARTSSVAPAMTTTSAIEAPPAPVPPPTPSALEPRLLPDAPSATVSAPKVARAVASVVPSADVDAAERSLLDQARRALREGEGERALDLVARHAHDFPKGSLVEEREVLRVNALVSVGRLDEARTRVEAFRRRFPASPFLPALDSQVRDR